DLDSLWHFGGEETERRAGREKPQPAPAVERFDSSGHYVLRPRSEVFLRLECGHWGDGRTWAHSHADRLSISLFIAGRPILVDPGTGFYLSDRSFREFFRSTQAHNTLTVDGQSQSDPLAVFLWGDPVESRIIELAEDADKIVIEGEQTGYSFGARWRMGVVHRRRIVAPRNIRRLEIEDIVQTVVPHELCLNFSFHPDCQIIQGNGENRAVEVRSGPWKIRLLTDKRLAASFHLGQDEPRRGWYSPAFKQVVPAPQICCRTETEVDLSLRTVIEWEAD
ncbi:MAG TPA: heparinase II/III-family protein, partial [Candidatus Glassbacteria bacterium]|nr:heparinase II/III-family protein [Candidatus Glassbacteria bacterium]